MYKPGKLNFNHRKFIRITSRDLCSFLRKKKRKGKKQRNSQKDITKTTKIIFGRA